MTRIAGLAHGWEGAAWVALHRVRAGLAPLRAGLVTRLLGQLASVEREPAGSPAALIGAAGAAQVAWIASELEPRFVPLARRATARWMASSCPLERDDVLLGHPGALLALGELVDLAPTFRAPRRWVSRCYRRTLAALRRTLASDAPHFLGFAHGTAGLLLAAECGAARLGQPRDPDLMSRGLERLAQTRLVAPGLGTLWAPSSSPQVGRIAHSWCHGAPGIALALHGCHRFSGDRDYRALFAEAVRAIQHDASPGRTFCCGRSGRAQILVELFRHSGDRRWLARARAVAAQPARVLLNRDQPAGFSQGRLGIAYLAARLAHPARLPLPATGVA